MSKFKLGLTWFLAIPMAVLYGAYAFSLLWAWFIVPVFSVPQVSIAQAAGITLIVDHLRVKSSDMKNSSDDPVERLSVFIVFSFLEPTLVLIAGWIIKQFL